MSRVFSVAEDLGCGTHHNHISSIERSRVTSLCKVPRAPHSRAALSCLQETDSRPAEPGWASNLSTRPLVRGGSPLPGQGPAVAVPPAPTQPNPACRSVRWARWPVVPGSIV